MQDCFDDEIIQWCGEIEVTKMGQIYSLVLKVWRMLLKVQAGLHFSLSHLVCNILVSAKQIVVLANYLLLQLLDYR